MFSRDLPIAYGASRYAKEWANKTITFDELKNRLKVPIRTPESAEEYSRMSKTNRDNTKDHGGFVGGALAGGQRKVDTVDCRSMISLDGDKINSQFLDDFENLMPYASALYTTHSSTPEKPRVRIVVPLTRDVSPDEFVAVSRYLAQSLGMDYFDECSYLPNQLMYWPSAPANGVFIYKETNKEWLSPDFILAAHPEWRDPTRLPTSSRESKANTLSRKKVQDPLTKDGVVGLFNRAFYPIQAALDRFLPDVYEPTTNNNRYHLIESHSMAGVEIIEDKFVYSHHAKDQAYLKLCNAFDIVRVHKFGDLDEKQSFSAMQDFASNIEDVKMLAASERQLSAADDFSNDDDEEAWKKQLRYNRNMVLENSLQNLTLIMQNDIFLKNIVYNQLADGLEVIGPLPWNHPGRYWREADDAQLVSYVDSRYGSFSQRFFDIALTKVADDRLYHPIQTMFETLPMWDGHPRVDSLLIDYLGAQDNPYVRAVTRKALCAAYYRVYKPGTKFDYMVVLNGGQGIGKSTLIAKLGMDWFSDSLSLSDMNDKTAAEKLLGNWILEISELAGMKKADIDKVKAFVSRQDDKYRASFGKHVVSHPRQCVIFGTTNNMEGYLRDITGNRRFWNVKVTGNGIYKPWDLDEETIKQIWAEVVIHAGVGEDLALPPDVEEYARYEQREAVEQDEREGFVEAYLNTLIPLNWDDMDIYKRRDFYRNPDDLTRPEGVLERKYVSNVEIWCECFGKNKEDMRPADSYMIAAIMSRISGWKKTGNRAFLPYYGRQRIYERE